MSCLFCRIAAGEIPATVVFEDDDLMAFEAGSGFGQPKFSREAIAEFQVVTNLFDITQGRSLGIQVQAISRSGTNNYDGSVYGYFRDDKWNAKDFIANRVLPYANQQLGGAFGGPLVKDKAHFFVSFERENEPNTILAAPASLPGQSFDFDTKLVHDESSPCPPCSGCWWPLSGAGI